MRTGCRILLRVSLLFVAVVAAGEKPNFTGIWKQDAARDRVCINEIEHRDPSLKLVTKFSWDSGRLLGGLFDDQTYSTDGTEQSCKSSKGRERWITVAWQGPALVFLAVDKQDCHVTVTRETWTLSDDGKTLTKARRIIGPAGRTDEKIVFEKQ